MRFNEVLKKQIQFDTKGNDFSSLERFKQEHFVFEDDFNYVKDYLKSEEDVEPKHRIDQKYVDEIKTINSLISSENLEVNLKVYEKLANDGNITALFFLGDAYCLGYGCKQDMKKGLKLVVQAAIKEQPQAQYKLGGLFYDGVYPRETNSFLIEEQIGRKLKLRSISAFWKYRSAMNGCKEAQYWYADDFLYGSYDVYRKLDESFLTLIELSAEQGFRQAQNKLVYILLNKNKGEFYNEEKGLRLAKRYYNSGNEYIETDLRKLGYNIRDIM